MSELTWRGLVQHVSPKLAERLERGPITGYVGFDPTAPSLQVGNLVPIALLTLLQRAGGKPIVVLGGGTGLIGDPSGKRSERPLLDEAQVGKNIERQLQQFGRFLEFGSGPEDAEMANNADWLQPLNLVDFLRDVGKHFTLAYMLQKESVKSRLDSGISYTETSYMLLQAYDFLHLYRSRGCELQMGGSDQWGNVTTGIELIRRAEGGDAYGLCAPLLVMSSGAKFGKTEAGTVWLDGELTSPYHFYQFWINLGDADAIKLVRLLTLLNQDEIREIELEHEQHPEARFPQRALAQWLTEACHGRHVAQRVERTSRLLFERQPDTLVPEDLRGICQTVPALSLPRGRLNAGRVGVVEAAVLTGLAASRGEARRLVASGGLYLGSRRVAAPDEQFTTEALLDGRYALLRRGDKRFCVIEFVDEGGRY